MGPLAGLKVVEVSGPGPGPFAGMMLADHGAEVVRVERKTGGDLEVHEDPRLVIYNRGKRQVALDLKAPADLQALLELVDGADAVVEGFRPGTAERLGFGPETCRARNPRLVYVRLTGWGQDGPYARRAGHDLNYVALAGALGQIGPAGGAPCPPLNLVGDFAGGAMYALFGLLSALYERERSGEGQVVDAAMVDGVASLLASTFTHAASGFHSRPRGENLLDGGDPTYGVYQTADGGWMAIGALEARFFAEALRRLGLDPALAERRRDRATWNELRTALAGAFRSRSRAEWEAVFDEGDACVTPVLSLAETETHHHLAARGSVIRVDGLLQPAVAPRFSRSVAEPVAQITPAAGPDRAHIAGRSRPDRALAASS